MSSTAGFRTTVTPGINVAGTITEWTEQIRTAFADLDMAPEALGKISIAVDELLTNIAKHSRPREGKKEIAVECLVEAAPTMAAVTFRDDGACYDPRKQPKPETSGDPMDLKIGGLGVALLFELFDSLEYRNENGCNESRWKLNLNEN